MYALSVKQAFQESIQAYQKTVHTILENQKKQLDDKSIPEHSKLRGLEAMMHISPHQHICGCS